MNTAGASSADVSAAVIRLHKGAHVDHGQACVVQQPVVYLRIAIVDSLCGANVDAAVGAALVSEADNPLAGNGCCRPILPRFTRVLRTQDFVAVLVAREHAPELVGIGPIDVEVDGLVVVVPVFAGRRRSQFPRCSAIG